MAWSFNSESYFLHPPQISQLFPFRVHPNHSLHWVQISAAVFSKHIFSELHERAAPHVACAYQAVPWQHQYHHREGIQQRRVPLKYTFGIQQLHPSSCTAYVLFWLSFVAAAQDIQKATDSGLTYNLFLPATFLSENGAERQKWAWNKRLLAAVVPNTCYLTVFLFLLATAEMINLQRAEVTFTLERPSRWWGAKMLRYVLVIAEMSLPVQRGSFLLAISLPFFPSQDPLTCSPCSCCTAELKAAVRWMWASCASRLCSGSCCTCKPQLALFFPSVPMREQSQWELVSELPVFICFTMKQEPEGSWRQHWCALSLPIPLQVCCPSPRDQQWYHCYSEIKGMLDPKSTIWIIHAVAIHRLPLSWCL